MDAVSAYPDGYVHPPVPRLGCGIVWADVVASIEEDQRRREDGTLGVYLGRFQKVPGFYGPADGYTHNGQLIGES
jgi:hypothetical protein